MRELLASASRGAQTAARINRGWQALIEEILADGAATGEFVCPDPGASSWRLLALLDGDHPGRGPDRRPGPADVEKWSYHAARVETGRA